MADFIQAAVWMDEGKEVRRKRRKSFPYWKDNDDKTIHFCEFLRIQDVLATDWEICKSGLKPNDDFMGE